MSSSAIAWAASSRERRSRSLFRDCSILVAGMHAVAMRVASMQIIAECGMGTHSTWNGNTSSTLPRVAVNATLSAKEKEREREKGESKEEREG